MVEESGAVAILDFGLARGKQSITLTLDSVMVGTPHYMSPEQALGRPTDARSDVYSIGVMGYEMLTGHGAVRRRVASRHRDEARLRADPGRAAAASRTSRRSSRRSSSARSRRTPPRASPPPPSSRPSSRCCGLSRRRPARRFPSRDLPRPPIPTPWEPTPASPPAAAPVPGAPAEAPPARPFSISSASDPGRLRHADRRPCRAGAPEEDEAARRARRRRGDARERKQLADAVSEARLRDASRRRGGEKALDLLLPRGRSTSS